MTGILEGGMAAAFACTSTATFGLSTYSHLRSERKIADEQPSTRQRDKVGPLRKEHVQISMDQKSIGRCGIEFNGEVLSIKSDDGAWVPAITLGAGSISVNGDRVIAVPSKIPSIQLTFADSGQALRWASEFKEAARLGPPHARVQELIARNLLAEKHVGDLMKRVQNPEELEKQNQKLKTNLGMVTAKTPFVIPSVLQPVCPTNVDLLRIKVQEQRDKNERAQAFAEALKRQMAEHVPLEVHMALHDQLRKQMEQSEKAQEEVACLQRRVDEFMPTAYRHEAPASVAIAPVADGLAEAIANSRQDELARDMEELQLELARRKEHVQEETSRAEAQLIQARRLEQTRDLLVLKLFKISNQALDRDASQMLLESSRTTLRDAEAKEEAPFVEQVAPELVALDDVSVSGTSPKTPANIFKVERMFTPEGRKAWASSTDPVFPATSAKNSLTPNGHRSPNASGQLIPRSLALTIASTANVFGSSSKTELHRAYSQPSPAPRPSTALPISTRPQLSPIPARMAAPRSPNGISRMPQSRYPYQEWPVS